MVNPGERRVTFGENQVRKFRQDDAPAAINPSNHPVPPVVNPAAASPPAPVVPIGVNNQSINACKSTVHCGQKTYRVALRHASGSLQELPATKDRFACLDRLQKIANDLALVGVLAGKYGQDIRTLRLSFSNETDQFSGITCRLANGTLETLTADEAFALFPDADELTEFKGYLNELNEIRMRAPHSISYQPPQVSPPLRHENSWVGPVLIHWLDNLAPAQVSFVDPFAHVTDPKESKKHEKETRRLIDKINGIKSRNPILSKLYSLISSQEFTDRISSLLEGKDELFLKSLVKQLIVDLHKKNLQGKTPSRNELILLELLTQKLVLSLPQHATLRDTEIPPAAIKGLSEILTPGVDSCLTVAAGDDLSDAINANPFISINNQITIYHPAATNPTNSGDIKESVSVFGGASYRLAKITYPKKHAETNTPIFITYVRHHEGWIEYYPGNDSAKIIGSLTDEQKIEMQKSGVLLSYQLEENTQEELNRHQWQALSLRDPLAPLDDETVLDFSIKIAKMRAENTGKVVKVFAPNDKEIYRLPEDASILNDAIQWTQFRDKVIRKVKTELANDNSKYAIVPFYIENRLYFITLSMGVDEDNNPIRKILFVDPSGRFDENAPKNTTPIEVPEPVKTYVAELTWELLPLFGDNDPKAPRPPQEVVQSSLGKERHVMCAMNLIAEETTVPKLKQAYLRNTEKEIDKKLEDLQGFILNRYSPYFKNYGFASQEDKGNYFEACPLS